MKLKDRVAIITGGARGIGKAIGSAFDREGAKVCLVDVDQGKLETTKNEIRKNREEILALTCDIKKMRK
jgi:NAD(P)-dependent dehydrogenase (short-subunit alcohol dehydrogenase family)